MMDKYSRLADVILLLEAEMRRQRIWSLEPPQKHQLESIQPFCVDTLNFQQWLQFIFLPRMKEILENGQQLPSCSDIASMANESFKKTIDGSETIVKLLVECEQIIKA